MDHLLSKFTFLPIIGKKLRLSLDFFPATVRTSFLFNCYPIRSLFATQKERTLFCSIFYGVGDPPEVQQYEVFVSFVVHSSFPFHLTLSFFKHPTPNLHVFIVPSGFEDGHPGGTSTLFDAACCLISFGWLKMKIVTGRDRPTAITKAAATTCFVSKYSLNIYIYISI